MTTFYRVKWSSPVARGEGDLFETREQAQRRVDQINQTAIWHRLTAWVDEEQAFDTTDLNRLTFIRGLVQAGRLTDEVAA